MALFPARASSAGLRSISNIAYPTGLQAGEHVHMTSDGDMVDEFGYAHYGFMEGVSEAIYARNLWLSRHQPILTAGLRVILPVIEKPTRATLWTY